MLILQSLRSQWRPRDLRRQEERSTELGTELLFLEEEWKKANLSPARLRGTCTRTRPALIIISAYQTLRYLDSRERRNLIKYTQGLRQKCEEDHQAGPRLSPKKS